jgi:hypothetical protein
MTSRSKIVSPLPNAALHTVLIIPFDHICASTAQLLEEEADERSHKLLLTIASWGTYGWFMWVPEDPGEQLNAEHSMPADLYHIFVYAKQAGADYLLIDTDAERNPDLPVYPEE